MSVYQIYTHEQKSLVASATVAHDSSPREAMGDPSAWMARAGDLADWALKNVVVRTDAYVEYFSVGNGGGVKVEQRTIKSPLTRDLLSRHFDGYPSHNRLAVHLVRPIDETCRLTVVDVDAHDPEDDPEANWQFVREVERRAAGRGVVTRIFSSDGAGGFHVWVFHPRPISCADSYRFGRWLIEGWKTFGLRTEPEAFPKSPGLTVKRFGSTIRLPGRHPKREHWTGVWDGVSDCWTTGFLRGEAAIYAILNTSVRTDRVPLGPLVPAEFVLPTKAIGSAAPVRILEPEELDREAARAREALSYLGSEYFENYHKWLAVGMALKRLGDQGLALWHEWSAQSKSRYRPDDLNQKWETFARPADEWLGFASQRPRTLGLGTLFKWAREGGWAPPVSEARPIAELAESYREALSACPEELAELASRLGVGEEALQKLGVGWREENRRPGDDGRWLDDGPAWTFPLSNGAGDIVGLLRRYEDETITDRLVLGSKMGLLVPAGWQDVRGPVLIVEGIDDAVALVDKGFCPIGRLEDDFGVEDLARLLRGVDREIVVVATNDREVSGGWPGKERAERVAQKLSDRLRRSVRKWLPREGIGGVRDFLNSRRCEIQEG